MSVDFKPYLAVAIRDAAETMVRREPGLVPHLVRSLRRRRNRIFRRLAHHLLNLFPNADFPAVEQTLLSRGMLNKARNWHEYTLLMQTCFKSLSSSDQDKILGWIDKGPDTVWRKKRSEERFGPVDADERVKQGVKAWKKERIGLISKDLPSGWKDRFMEYTSDLDPSAHLESVHQTTRVFGTRPSPDEGKNLEDLSVEQIVDFLKIWEPTNDWMGPSRESIGRDLFSAVSSDPKRFAADAQKFQDVKPVYIQSVIGGLNEALTKNLAFEWPNVIQMLDGVVSRKR